MANPSVTQSLACFFFSADALERPGVSGVAQEELSGRIAHAGLLQFFQFVQTLNREFGGGHFGVEPQRGLELFGLQGPAGEFVEAGAQRLQVVGMNDDARRHRMAAMAQQQVVALAQSGGQIETLRCSGPIRAIRRRRRR